MINREYMLELTRRMTPTRTSITRVAGCYIDQDGEFDESFNTNFLKLSGSDRAKNLKLAKTVPFSDSNNNLKKYEFVAKAQKPGSMWQLLMAMKECGLKNDALMDTQALGGVGGAAGGGPSRRRGEDGHQHHQPAGLPDHRHVVPLDALVDDPGQIGRAHV